MKVSHIVQTPSVVLRFDEPEIALLVKCSLTHYDEDIRKFSNNELFTIRKHAENGGWHALGGNKVETLIRVLDNVGAMDDAEFKLSEQLQQTLKKCFLLMTKNWDESRRTVHHI